MIDKTKVFLKKIFPVLFAVTFFVVGFVWQTGQLIAADAYCSYTEGNYCCQITGTYSNFESCPGGSSCYPAGTLPGLEYSVECYCHDPACGASGSGQGSYQVPPPPQQPEDAAIEVIISGSVNPSLINWNIDPGSYSGTGNDTVIVFPPDYGQVFTISNYDYPGCSVSVSNSDGGATSLTMFPGTYKAFYLDYVCTSQPSVDIKANNSDGPISISAGQSPNLTWTSTNATSCSASGSWSGPKATSGSQSTGSLGSGSYRYTITCVASGSSQATDFVDINVSPGTPPSAPTISASASGSTCQAVTITWNSVSGATGYKVYRDSSLIVDIVSSSATSYIDQGLNGGQTYSYKVRAYNASGDSSDSNTASAQASATCPSAAATVSLSGSPSSVWSGQSSTLTWTTGNSPSSCTASASPANAQWTGSKSTVSGSAQTITNLTKTTTFTITCTNSFGGNSSSKTITVTGGAAPIVDLQANPGTVNDGDSSVLTWTVQNGASGCNATGGFSGSGWSGAKSVTGGSQTISNIDSTWTYTLTCNNAYGTDADSVDIYWTSDPTGPVVNLTANPTTVTSGGNTVLTWDPVLNAVSCSPNSWPYNSQWYTGTKSPNGDSQTITNLTQTTSFTLICSKANGAQGQDSENVTVTSLSASLGVSTNNSSASWTISPGGISDGGTSGGPYAVNPGTGGTTYTISPNSISGYTHTVTYVRNGTTGSGSSITLFPGDNATFTVTYTSSGPSFNYSMSNSGDVYVTKTSGNALGQAAVNLALTQGTTQSVTISTSGAPSGVSVSHSNNPCSPTCTATVVFTVTPGTSAGTYPITVTGSTSGLPNKTTNFNLVVSNPPNLSATLTPSPTSARVGEVVNWSCNASGGTGTYTYTWSGTDFPTPSPTTSSVNVTYQAVGTKTATCTVNDGIQSVTSPQSTVIITINPTFEEF